MKRKLLYIFFAAVISFTSTGFGFLESSSAVHRRANHSAKTDSLKINTVNISLKNTSIHQKEIQKPANESFTKSIMQWVANAVRNTIETAIVYVVKILQSVAVDLINFFTK
jgi:hypothetical protein